VWFKQACESNASIDTSHLKRKALHSVTQLGINKFSIYNDWIGRFMRRPTLLTEIY
jgi:hypothetical protein